MQEKLGNKWAEIARKLRGRTDNDVKNWWSTRQKRLRKASAAVVGAAGVLPLQQQPPPLLLPSTPPSRSRSVLPSSSALPHGVRSLKLKGPIYEVGESSRQQLSIPAGPADAVTESDSGAHLVDVPLPLLLPPLSLPPPVRPLLQLLPSWPCRRRGSVGQSVLPSSSAALSHGLSSLKIKGQICEAGHSIRQQLSVPAGPADAVKESDSGGDLVDAPLPLPLSQPPPVWPLIPLLPSWACRRRGSVGQSVLPSSSALSHGLSSLKLKGQICEAGQSSRPQAGPANTVKDESNFGADLVDAPLPLPAPVAATAEPSSGPGLASLHATVTSLAPTRGLDHAPQEPNESNATAEGTEPPVTYSSLELLFTSHLERVARVSDEALTFGMDNNNAIPSFTAVETEPPRTYHRKVPFGADLNAMAYKDFIKPLAEMKDKPLSSDPDNPFVVQEPPFPKPYAEPLKVQPPEDPNPFSHIEDYFPYAETKGTTEVRFDDLSPESLAFFDNKP